MGFKDKFVDGKSGNYSVKIQCTECRRVTVVKIPSRKTFEKWSEGISCGQCNAKNCWVRAD